MNGREVVALLGAYDRADRRIRELEQALGLIDRMLTTVEGDNVPRGDAPKMHVRNIARRVLEGGSVSRGSAAVTGREQQQQTEARLHLVPVTLAQANEHVAAWHRHNAPVPGAKFCVGAADEGGVLHAVAIAGRPVARHFDDGMTIEVVRVASDGARNACSMLYGACKRAAFALGYRRVVTYTQGDESGSSLRAAGWKVIAERPARVGWSVPSRPRDNTTYRSTTRQLWEAVA